MNPIAVATHGKISGLGTGDSDGSFCPILQFDVFFTLSKPTGLHVENLDTLSIPSGFNVEDTAATVSTPLGFVVEGPDTIQIPAGFHVEDTDYVSRPTGFAVEDV